MPVRTRVKNKSVQGLEEDVVYAQARIFEYGLEDVLKDRFTGFQGAVVYRAQYNNGCIRYGLQSIKLDKDGKPVDVQVFDQGDLELVKRAKPRTSKPTEGPPTRGRDPAGRA